MPDGIGKCFPVAGAYVSSAQGFSRIGETVHHVREKGEELHQQRVYRQDNFTLRAPAEVKNNVTATRHNVRRKMSRFTWKKRIIASF